jgi:glycosyltransferase involved in cell wall biosynthesis
MLCTYNRAESLKKTLDSFVGMTVPNNISWELLIIDNNSSDHTKNLVKEFHDNAQLPIRYFLEERQGLSHARNRGIREASGEIIAFTDDDVIIDKLWLQNIGKDFKILAAACIGGKILPIWEHEPPAWLSKEFYSYLALLDLGEEYVRLTKPTLWGANFSVRSAMFKKYGLFNTDVGRTPTKLYGLEETFFIETLIQNKETVMYSPYMLVHHCIPKKRLKKSYFRKWHFDQGELKGLQISNRKFGEKLKVSFWALRAIIIGLLKFLWLCLVKPNNAFRQELRTLHNMGFFVGLMKCIFIPNNSSATLVTPKA